MPRYWRESYPDAPPVIFTKCLLPTYSYSPLLPRYRALTRNSRAPVREADLATKTIAAAEKAKTRQDYVSSFATAVTRLASNNAELLAIVPQILVTEFGATRSELWLWDES